MKKLKKVIFIHIISKIISSLFITGATVIGIIAALRQVNTISFDSIASPIAIAVMLTGLGTLFNYLVWSTSIK